MEPIATGGVQLDGLRRGSEAQREAEAGRLGMWLFLASLGMLFGAGLLGHLIIRFRQPVWPPEGAPGLPGGIWISTALLAATSAVLVWAERAVRSDRLGSLYGTLWAALGLGIAFITMQIVNWSAMATAVAATGEDLYTFTYWSLTVLHGLHVVGGLIPLTLITYRTSTGRYGSRNVGPVHNVALYWHFLGVTWIGILVVLLV
jgi:heme/copper-type cytochrome/quinol oxidase subunit 3